MYLYVLSISSELQRLAKYVADDLTHDALTHWHLGDVKEILDNEFSN